MPKKQKTGAKNEAQPAAEVEDAKVAEEVTAGATTENSKASAQDAKAATSKATEETPEEQKVDPAVIKSVKPEVAPEQEEVKTSKAAPI
jgi:hypothetical protein